MIGKELQILDTTLRDGNYFVDFQFTTLDVINFCRNLEECGINYIEIGHGLGLGASSVYRSAAATDEEYIKAAKKSLNRAKFGMFAIPGIATTEHIVMASDLGMDFIRIGANLDDIGKMEPLIEESRRLGLFVCTNFMKSYELPPDDFSKIGLQAERMGSQLNYVVDSAGSMLPEEVNEYFLALHDVTSIPSGFHGHDNIHMAVANTLESVNCGATLVDTTLLGIGRGSGNTPTELAAILLSRTHKKLDNIDNLKLRLLAERDVAPLIYQNSKHDDVVSMSLGLSRVHSMHQDKITDIARTCQVNIHHLIDEIGFSNKVNLTTADIELAALNIKNSTPINTG
jgi:4-hydroxy 2-oxovalerate aldolase